MEIRRVLHSCSRLGQKLPEKNPLLKLIIIIYSLAVHPEKVHCFRSFFLTRKRYCPYLFRVEKIFQNPSMASRLLRPKNNGEIEIRKRLCLPYILHRNLVVFIWCPKRLSIVFICCLLLHSLNIYSVSSHCQESTGTQTELYNLSPVGIVYHINTIWVRTLTVVTNICAC